MPPIVLHSFPDALGEPATSGGEEEPHAQHFSNTPTTVAQPAISADSLSGNQLAALESLWQQVGSGTRCRAVLGEEGGKGRKLIHAPCVLVQTDTPSLDQGLTLAYQENLNPSQIQVGSLDPDVPRIRPF